MKSPFYEMHRNLCSSPHFTKMQKTIAPLKDYFNVNYFWHYTITSNNNYIFIGSHPEWAEYNFNSDKLKHYPCLRDPQQFEEGIFMMNRGFSSNYHEILCKASSLFSINFQFQFIKKNNDGIKAYGFASEIDHFSVTNKLLNNVNLLCKFINFFHEENSLLINSMNKYLINLPEYFGDDYYNNESLPATKMENEAFLKAIYKNHDFIRLTKREKDILPLIAQGLSASYIADTLYVSRRTVENHLSRMKEKLSCQSKIDLIKKAQQFC